MRSWLSRESFCTRRPKITIGSTTAGITSAERPARCGLDRIIIAAAPSSVTTLRNATDSVEPTTVCTSSVSAARRETSSPVRVFSKNAWSSVSR